REHFIEPFVELEPAFVLRRGLRGPNITVADIISAINYVLPAIEIIDSRVQNWAIDLPGTLADNGSTGSVILGGTPRLITTCPSVQTRPAFVLRARLPGPNLPVPDIINAINYVLPAIQIIGSRVQDWAIDPPGTLADHGSAGSVILGGTPRLITTCPSGTCAA